MKLNKLFAAIAIVTSANALASASIASEYKKQAVQFNVDGQTIRGDLYVPTNTANRNAPALVIGGSLTSVKEQMSATYAEKLAKQGIVALAIDYRHYGKSDGMPRQLENTETKKADLKAALNYLSGLSYVDRNAIGLLGICTSGGNVLQAAAEDSRVKVVATVAGWFVEPSMAPALYGGPERARQLIEEGRVAASKFSATGKAATVQTYGPAGSSAAHAGDHLAYYFDTKRGNVPAWTNQMAVQSWESWLAFDPVSAAKKVTAATLIVHSNDSALPDQARKVFAALPGQKSLRWLEGAHFDFYDNDQKVTEAASEIASFVKQTAASNAAVALR
jgi:uncharacterized protein